MESEEHGWHTGNAACSRQAGAHLCAGRAVVTCNGDNDRKNIEKEAAKVKEKTLTLWGNCFTFALGRGRVVHKSRPHLHLPPSHENQRTLHGATQRLKPLPWRAFHIHSPYQQGGTDEKHATVLLDSVVRYGSRHASPRSMAVPLRNIR